MPNFSGKPPRGGAGSFNRKPAAKPTKWYGKYDKDKVPASVREGLRADRSERPAKRLGITADKPERPYAERFNKSVASGRPAGSSYTKPRHVSDRERFEEKKRLTPPPRFDKQTPAAAISDRPPLTRTSHFTVAGSYAKQAGDRRSPLQGNERIRPKSPRTNNERMAAPTETDREEIDTSMLIVGRNPIREALRAGRDFEKLMVAEGDLHGSAHEIIALAKERRVIIQTAPRVALDKLAHENQGMVGVASAYKYSTVEDILTRAGEREEKPFVIILDGITDPHNLGAIIRTAECAGAHGVIVPERRAVGLTSAAVKASAGAAMHLPVARVVNISQTVDRLKAQGIWIAAATQDGSAYDKTDLSGALALVIGSEGAGISRLVLEKCDMKVALPMRGKTESLNASVAAGVLIYEIIRRRYSDVAICP